MSALQQTIMAIGSNGPTDPYFSSVKLLCHYDGSNGQTTTVDSSSNARTITRVGVGQLSTAQSKFGGSSSFVGSTPGNVGNFRCADSADWNFSNGQFTVESWVRFTSAPASVSSVICQWASGSLGFFFGHVSGSLAFYYSTTGANNPNVGAAWTPTLNTWYHIAADRDGSNVLRVYLDGVVHASATAAVTFFDSTAFLELGGCSTFAGIEGYVEDQRITKGVARYAGAFTPPTAAFPNS